MKRLQVGVLSLLIASPSYAWAASSEGAAMKPAVVAPAKTMARALVAAEKLQASAKANLRGANETRVYQAASPAVVLVVSKDMLGSGALIAADGRIITNLHVVGDEDEVAVVFKPRVEGQEIGKADLRPAKVIKRDPVADLALLQVASVPAGVTPLKLGSAASVQVGADVHAIGHPTGEAWTYTRGVVSQIRKDYAWMEEHRATVIQTQTPINPGNSGGPLINDRLEIVGVNSFKADGEGLNFAVSADDVQAFLDRKGERKPLKAKKQACEPVDLAIEKVKDPDGVEYETDEDCDGKTDYVTFIPDDKREPIEIYFDDNGDGEIDIVMYDVGRDDDLDAMLLDTDYNGKFDTRTYHRDGEEEPYRVERIAEE
jgi:S1-C subfamily serine protease